MTHQRRLQLIWEEHGGRDCLEVRGWTETELRQLTGRDAGEAGRRLALYTSEALADGSGFRVVPPVAGRFIAEDAVLRFVPRFPFADGISYSLLINNDGAEPEVWSIDRASMSSRSDTKVVAIYPSAGELPVNLLRIYIYFSAPMSEGWAATAIRVCREDTGAPVEDVFLPPTPELWDPERRRLTMLLDPGRIKRGLVPNLEAGYPLVAGVPISLSVDAQFRDASGAPLRALARRRYGIGAPLRSRIDIDSWRLAAPAAATRTALVVEFGRALDFGLLQHGLRVGDATGAAVSGEGEAGAAESSWRFTPSRPWEPGHYRLLVAPRLEDVAGNTPVRVFDRDLTLPEDTPPEGSRLGVGFSCS